MGIVRKYNIVKSLFNSIKKDFKIEVIEALKPNYQTNAPDFMHLLSEMNELLFNWLNVIAASTRDNIFSCYN